MGECSSEVEEFVGYEQGVGEEAPAVLLASGFPEEFFGRLSFISCDRPGKEAEVKFVEGVGIRT